MRRFVSLFVLVSALTLIATVTGSSSGTKVPAVVAAGTISGCLNPNGCTAPPASTAVSAGTGGGEYTFTSQSNIFLGQVQCVFRSGVDFAAVGGTFTANQGGALVGHPYVVYFSAQTATRPDIDPVMPTSFPKKCPSTAPSDATFYPLLSGSITYG
jgi:hypothetical protein